MKRLLFFVASPAEAWIETACPRRRCGSACAVASPAEAWIETGAADLRRAPDRVASPAEAWIETLTREPIDTDSKGRLPCGGVD